jgi:hypothetical protein
MTLGKERHDDAGANELGETKLDRPVRDFSQPAEASLGRVVDEKETELGRPTFDLDGNLVVAKPPVSDREVPGPARRPALDAAPPPRRPTEQARAHPPPSRGVRTADPKLDTLLYLAIGVVALLILVLSVAIAIGLGGGFD